MTAIFCIFSTTALTLLNESILLEVKAARQKAQNGLYETISQSFFHTHESPIDTRAMQLDQAFSSSQARELSTHEVQQGIRFLGHGIYCFGPR